MTDIATPPATGVWYDLDVTLAAVLHVLRLQGGDIDAALIRALIPVVGIRIDGYVDDDVVIDGPPPAADYQYALEQIVLLRYRGSRPYEQGGGQSVQAENDILDSSIGHRRARWAVA